MYFTLAISAATRPGCAALVAAAHARGEPILVEDFEPSPNVISSGPDASRMAQAIGLAGRVLVVRVVRQADEVSAQLLHPAQQRARLGSG